MSATLDMLEARPEVTPSPGASPLPAHAPAVFQSADHYGEETVELETACRLLGNNCTYELQQLIQIHHAMLEQMDALKPKSAYTP